MKLIALILPGLMTASFFTGALASNSGDFTFRIIRCQNRVNVYERGGPVPGNPVEIEFPDESGHLKREAGTVKYGVAGPGSVDAQSKNAFVRGTSQGNGYFILKPAHDPYPGNCLSLPPAP